MLATELINHLQKAIEQYGDKKVYVDCTLEGLSTESRGVYLDVESNIFRIGDEDFEEVEDFVKERGEKSGYKIIELR